MSEEFGLRIVHLPDLVGGHPSSLSLGERKLGALSQTLSYADSPFGYRSDIRLVHAHSSLPRRWLERVMTVASIRRNFNVFHFNFGASLLSSSNGRMLLADLPFYPADAVRVMTFQGSDVRLSYEPVLEKSLEEERKIQGAIKVNAQERRFRARADRQIRTVELSAKYCDRLLALNPDLLQFLPEEKACFFPYAIEPPEIDAAFSHSAQEQTRPLHFVHCSTNRVLKGTGLIEAALEAAQKRVDITYSVVVNVDRRQALRQVAEADVFIDQMILGWYGAAAVEAMYLGKPVVGFISDVQKRYAPQDLLGELPIIQTTCEELADMIVSLVESQDQLTISSEVGRKFAEKWHKPEVVARQSIRLYDAVRSQKGVGGV